MFFQNININKGDDALMLRYKMKESGSIEIYIDGYLMLAILALIKLLY